MPIFEYVCDKCGYDLETLQKASEAPLKVCESCGKKGLRKKISAAGFRLSGSGWYETDFKSGNKKNVSGSSETPGVEKSGSDNNLKKDGGGDSTGKGSTKASGTTDKTSKSSDGKSKSGGDK